MFCIVNKLKVSPFTKGSLRTQLLSVSIVLTTTRTLTTRRIHSVSQKTSFHANTTFSRVAERCAITNRKGFKKLAFSSFRASFGRTEGRRRDAVGMLIPDSILQSEHVNYNVFDRKLEECSREILGLDETGTPKSPSDKSVSSIPSASCSTNYGAAFDYSAITFHGTSRDAKRIAEAPISRAIASPPLGDKVSDRGTNTSKLNPSFMCSVRERELENISENMVAYLHTTPQHPQTPPPPFKAKSDNVQTQDTASHRVAELDNGEKVPVRREHYSAIRRVVLGSRDNSVEGQFWLDKILLEPNVIEAILPKGDHEDGNQDADVDVASQRRCLRRLREAARSDMKHGLTRHPCRIQGQGCSSSLKGGHFQPTLNATSISSVSSHTASAICPHTEYPSVCCVDHLGHGRCRHAELGCCPWFHGDPGPLGPQRILAEFLITDEGVEDNSAAEVVSRLRKSSFFVGRILQIIVDLITVVMEEDPRCDTYLRATNSGSDINACRLTLLREAIQLRCRTRSDLTPASRSHEGEMTRWLNILKIPTLHSCGSKEMESSGSYEWCLGLDLTVVRSLLSTNRLDKNVALEDLDTEAAARQNDNLLPRMHASPIPGVRVKDRNSSGPQMLTHGKFEPSNLAVEEFCRLWSCFFSLGRETTWTSIKEVPQKTQYLRLSPLFNQWAVDRAAEEIHDGRNSPPSKQDDADERDTLTNFFQSAAAHLLLQRVQDCEEFLRRFSSPSRGSLIPLAAELGRLRWAPLLLLQDCARLQKVCAEDLSVLAGNDNTKAAELEEMSSLPRLFREDANASSELEISSIDPPVRQTDCLELPSSFVFDILMKGYVDVVTPRTPTTQKGAVEHPHHARVINSDLALTWHALHAIFLKLGLGILHCMEATRATAAVTPIQNVPPNTNTTAITQLFPSQKRGNGSAAGLFTFVQNALLNLAFFFSSVLGKRFERPLLNCSGWVPWAEQSALSEGAQKAFYTPARFARHHQPVVKIASVNSLLNGLLLVVLQRAERVHGLSDRSPVQRLLSCQFLGDAHNLSEDTHQWFERQAGVLSKVHLHRFRNHIHTTHSLRPYIEISLSIWSSLHDHSRRVSELREEAIKEFRKRCTEWNAERSSRKAHVRTRKYRDTSLVTNLDDQSTPSAIDVLLPYGTVVLSAAAISRLLVLLREGGLPFKSLRLAASVIHGARKLRHAARQLQPQWLQTTKIVHRMTRCRSTNRKHVTAVPVPVMKLINGPEGDRCTGHSAKAIGLLYALDEGVLHEAMHVALRMGKVGLKLSDGIREDCVRGTLIDYTEDRCLPTPTPELVQAYLSWHFQAEPPKHTRVSIVPSLLQLVGLHPQKRAGPRSSRVIEVDEPVFGRRIPPTPLLSEVLFTYTDPEDVSRHRACLSLVQKDVHRFGTPTVCFAMQYRVMCRRPSLALSVMNQLWVHTIPTVVTPWVRQLQKDPTSSIEVFVNDNGRKTYASEQYLSWQQLCHAAEEELKIQEGLWAARMNSTQLHANVASGVAPSTIEELKAYLEGRHSSGTPSPVQHNTSPKPVLPSYERLLYQIWMNYQRNGSYQVQLLWSICTATLLGLSGRELEAAHTTHQLAAKSLFYSFVAALAMREGAGVNTVNSRAQCDHTLQVLLLSGLCLDAENEFVSEVKDTTITDVGTIDRAGARTRKRRGLRGCDGTMLAHNQPLKVQGLQTFLALQQQLGTEVLSQYTKDRNIRATGGVLAFPTSCNLLLGELKTFINTCETGDKVNTPPPHAWELLRSFLTQPSLALAWLEQTLLKPNEALLVWIAAHIDYHDVEELKALIGWIEALPRQNVATCAILAQIRKDYAAAQSNGEKLRKRHHFGFHF